MTNIKKLQNTIEPLRQELFAHTIYQKVQTLPQLKLFMQYHVYAVWDFMNLITSLQQEFTTTSTPWIPPKSHSLARLINEIKLEEESDIINGQAVSHF